MPRMAGQALSVAANSVSTNQVAGQLYEFLSGRTKLVFAAASSAVGLNATLLLGGRAVLNDAPISQANRFPLLPDDIVIREIASGRIVLTFRNTTAGALTVNWLIDVLR